MTLLKKPRLRKPEMVEESASSDSWGARSCAIGPRKKQQENYQVLAGL
jgi:hypothetical protein